MESKSHDKGRFSTRKKVEAVLRLLRGEDLDTLSRELGLTAARLSGWREVFLAQGTTGLKSRQGDTKEAEITQLKEMVGDLSMRLELSREAVRRLKEGSPLASRRSKP